MSYERSASQDRALQRHAMSQPNIDAYVCADYMESELATLGFWDAAGQIWIIVPLSEVEELAAEGFLVVGRPGSDGISLGYRRGYPGFWAYRPIDREYELLAATVAEFLDGWRNGTITV